MQLKKHRAEKIDLPRKIDNDRYMDLAAAIKYRRLALGYTQAELATALGIERQRVVVLETAGYLPSIRTLLKVAHGLGVSASSLVRDAERMAKK